MSDPGESLMSYRPEQSVSLAFSQQLDDTLHVATVTVLLLFSSDSGPVFSLLSCSGANRKTVFNMLDKFSFA